MLKARAREKSRVLFLFYEMSIRIRNNHLYFRKSITVNGKKHYLERRDPEFEYKPKPEQIDISKDQIEAIFKRFQEPHTAFIPLHLVYHYGIEPEAVYEAPRGQEWPFKLLPETVRIFRRNEQRIEQLSRVYGYLPSDKLVINLRTGKPISHYQMGYVSKVIRRDINPSWSWERWKSQKFHHHI